MSASLANLPLLRDDWEILVFPVRDEGLLLIVAEITGCVRLFAPVPPGVPVPAVLRDAFTAPEAGTAPGRPRAVRVLDAAALAYIQPLLTEANVLASVVGALPAAMEALTTLLASAGPRAPGLTRDLPAWRVALSTLATMAPWRRLRDNVHFVFHGGGLAGQVAVVIGHENQNRGVVLFPSETDLDAYRRRLGTGSLGKARTLNVLLEPRDEISAEERAACREAGLVFSGLHAKAYTMTPEGFRPPDPAEERTMLEAISVVLAMCKEELPALAAGLTRRRTFPALGVEVEAGRGVRPPTGPVA